MRNLLPTLYTFILIILCAACHNRQALPPQLANADTLITRPDTRSRLEEMGRPDDSYAAAVWNAIMYHRFVTDYTPKSFAVWKGTVPGDSLRQAALAYFEQHRDPYFLALINYDEASIDFLADRMDVAQEKLLDAARQLEKVDEGYRLKYLVYSRLGTISFYHRMPEAEDYYTKAHEAALNGGSKAFIASTLQMMALCRSNKEDYTTALGYMHRAIGIARQLNYALLEESIWGDMSRVYFQKGDADSCLVAARASAKIRVSRGLSPYQYVTALYSMRSFLQKQQPDSALFYADRAIETGDIYTQQEVYDALRNYYRTQKLTADADRYDRLYLQVTDSIDALSKLSTLKQEQHNYNREQTRNEVHKAENERNHSILIGAAVAVVLTVIIVFGRRAYLRRLRSGDRRLHEHEATISTLQTNLEEAQTQVREVGGRLEQVEKRGRQLSETLANDTQLVRDLRQQPRFLQDAEWEQLHLLADRVYDNYSTRLHQRFPQLTEQEVRLCLLIRLQFINAQLAILFGVSPASVSQKKFRLKKHLTTLTEDGFPEGMTLEQWVEEN